MCSYNQTPFYWNLAPKEIAIVVTHWSTFMLLCAAAVELTTIYVRQEVTIYLLDIFMYWALIWAWTHRDSYYMQAVRIQHLNFEMA